MERAFGMFERISVVDPKRERDLAPGGEVIFTQAGIFSVSTHYGNIQGGASMTIPPGVRSSTWGRSPSSSSAAQGC